jgi:hypothetical protein
MALLFAYTVNVTLKRTFKTIEKDRGGYQMNWTEQDLQILLNNYQKMTNKQLSGLLGRPAPTINSKLEYLGLRRKESVTNSCGFTRFPESIREDLGFAENYWSGLPMPTGKINVIKGE